MRTRLDLLMQAILEVHVTFRLAVPDDNDQVRLVYRSERVFDTSVPSETMVYLSGDDFSDQRHDLELSFKTSSSRHKTWNLESYVITRKPVIRSNEDGVISAVLQTSDISLTSSIKVPPQFKDEFVRKIDEWMARHYIVLTRHDKFRR